MTPQIARLSATRLASAPRPLRLCYSGQVLRVRGDQLRPERQFTQTGIELMGSDAVAAEAEVLLLVADALRAAGIENLTVDLTVPSLAPLLLTGRGYDAEQSARAREALDGKDAGELATVVGDDPVIGGLLEAVGTADEAVARLAALEVSGEAGQLIARLAHLVSMVRESDPRLSLTIDPGEYRGFEYQSGIAFAFFAGHVRGELARGGRYETDAGETAVGATVYLDAVVRGLAEGPDPVLAYAPFGARREAIVAAQQQGYAVVAGLAPESDPEAEARRLGCRHILRGADVTALD
jgi:ATP phosphoribosyltransferase regulatory subunit